MAHFDWFSKKILKRPLKSFTPPLKLAQGRFTSVTSLAELDIQHCELLFSLSMDELSGIALPEFHNELVNFSQGKKIDAQLVQRYLLLKTEKKVERELGPKTLHGLAVEQAMAKNKRLSARTAPHRFTAPSIISLLAALCIDFCIRLNVLCLSCRMVGISTTRRIFFINSFR